MKILITGASGFIGKPLIHYLLEHTDAQVVLILRKPINLYKDHPRVQTAIIQSLDEKTDWDAALKHCTHVIHAAARVHIMDKKNDSEQEYQRINYKGTVHLAQKAREAGVRRFIYLSSIKVNGEYTLPQHPFKEADKANPQDAYARSKYYAEQGLLAFVGKGDMEVVIIRPPLVYGPGVKGNFLSLISLLQKGFPLPLGAMRHNKRSFVSLGNLLHFIYTCTFHPKAGNQIFLISDNQDLSTTELLLKIRLFLPKKALLLPFPCWLLNHAATLFGKKQEMQRLTASLQVDISKAKILLDWSPVEPVEDALAKTIETSLG